MLGKQQFSLSYLMLETFWVASALGSFRAGMSLPDDFEWLGLPAILFSVASAGAAIGGLYGRMIMGALIAIALMLIGALFVPAVQHA